MTTLKTRFFSIALLAAAASPALAQSALDKLSPSARAEVEKLTPAERSELSGGAPASDGGDFLCTRWGCVGGTFKASVDGWHSTLEGDYPGNFGASVGAEAAAPIPGLQDRGVGAQASFSYGLADWNGRDSVQPQANYQQQQFYSVGLFRRPDPTGSVSRRWGLGATYDVSGNRSAGSRTDTFTLRQWRFKGSYYLAQAHEVGVWAAVRDNTASVLGNSPFFGPFFNTVNSYRAADQLNFFYKYALANGGSLSVYGGPGIGASIFENRIDNFFGGFIPGHGAHAFRATFGAGAVVPMSDRLALYANAAYAVPDISPMRSPQTSVLTASSLSAGIRFYWGANARVHDDTGRRWMPYLPAPDNGSFITQSNFVD